MADDRHIELGERLLRGTASPAEETEWARLVEQRPEFGVELRRQAAMHSLLLARVGAMPSRPGMAEQIGRETAQPRSAESRLPEFDARRISFRRWRMTVAAAAVLLGVGLLVNVQLKRLRPVPGPTRAVASVQDVRGTVTVRHAEIDVPARVNQALYADQKLITQGAASSALIVYGEAVQLGVRGNTELALHTTAPAPVGPGEALLLTHGAVQVAISRTTARKPLFVTPHAIVQAVGTRFLVTVSAAETRVEVEEAVVKFTARSSGKSVLAQAGFYASVGAGPEPTIGRLQRAGAGRVGEGLLALYTFLEQRGSIVPDVSGSDDPLPLQIVGERWAWLKGGGLSFPTGEHRVVAATPRTPRRLYAACTGSDELTVETWLRPSAPIQLGPTRIVVLDAPGQRGKLDAALNWAVCHGEVGGNTPGANVNFRVRTSRTRSLFSHVSTTSNPLQTIDNVQHIVCTYSPAGGMRIYVNGQLEAHKPEGGSLDSSGPTAWYPDCVLGVGNRNGDLDRGWQGDIFLLAIYARALMPQEIVRNFIAGPPASSVSQFLKSVSQNCEFMPIFGAGSRVTVPDVVVRRRGPAPGPVGMVRAQSWNG
ncbi:MAG: hypothetical protein JXR37_05130 [Kiritimatiellae bacterium]|nr:hypothetical protein [Kiritimatiellia bacterium]